MSPGHWGIMKTAISNPSDQDREALSIVYFDTEPGIQFGRKVWVPAQSRRVVSIPVLIPENTIEDQQRRGEFVVAAVNIMLLDQSGEQERIMSPDWQQLAVQSEFFLDNTGQPITVLISGNSNNASQLVGGLTEDQIINETFRGMRLSRGLKETVSELSDFRVPVVPALLDSADQLIVRGNRLATDAPGRTAIRQWVQRGGRLWVMLDSMDEETCQRLLGDACSIEYVDRVGLVNFQSKLTDDFREPTERRRFASDSIGELNAQEHEQPVEFVRAIVDDCEVIATIDGWPSIFKKDFGRGTILFTTMGTRALSRQKHRGERLPGMEKVKRVPRQELETIAEILFSEEQTPEIDVAELAPLIERGIGYRVPGRGLVLTILFGFCIALTLVGTWLAKSELLGHLVWIAPVAALLATIPLIAVANATQQVIPPTVVEAQYIEVMPSGDDLFVQGLTGVYDNQAGARKFSANSTSIFFPDRSGISGVWRMIWSDLDKCEWKNVSMPSGLRQVPFSTTVHATSPFHANGTFGPEGFLGNVECPNSNIRDAVVASSTRVSLAVDIEKGKLTEPAESTLDPGNYIASNLLSDEQICHQQVYRNLVDLGQNQDPQVSADEGSDEANKQTLATRFTRDFLKHPKLLAWTDPMELGYEFGDDMQKKGAALVVMPIRLHPPEPNQSIRIPSVFLPYESVRGPKNEGFSVAYDSKLGIWPRQSVDTKTTLRFQLPECVLPFQPSSAKLRVKINAPNRSIDIQSGAVQSLVPQGNAQEAMGELVYRITDPKALTLDENGGLHVRVAVGKPRSGNSATQKDEWKIEFVDLELEGTYSPKE